MLIVMEIAKLEKETRLIIEDIEYEVIDNKIRTDFITRSRPSRTFRLISLHKMGEKKDSITHYLKYYPLANKIYFYKKGNTKKRIDKKDVKIVE